MIVLTLAFFPLLPPLLTLPDLLRWDGGNGGCITHCTQRYPLVQNVVFYLFPWYLPAAAETAGSGERPVTLDRFLYPRLGF